MANKKNHKTTLIIEGYEPFDLLRLEKDAFYLVVEQAFFEANGKYVDIRDMQLDFDTVPSGDYEQEVVIKATVTSYSIEE